MCLVNQNQKLCFFVTKSQDSVWFGTHLVLFFPHAEPAESIHSGVSPREDEEPLGSPGVPCCDPARLWRQSFGGLESWEVGDGKHILWHLKSPSFPKLHIIINTLSRTNILKFPLLLMKLFWFFSLRTEIDTTLSSARHPADHSIRASPAISPGGATRQEPTRLGMEFYGFFGVVGGLVCLVKDGKTRCFFFGGGGAWGWLVDLV